MAETEDRPSRCSGCGTPLAGAATVDITLRSGDKERRTVLCSDCATVGCRSCGNEVSIGSVLARREDIWESHKLYECVRCEESVPQGEIAELRHENDPGYRKRVCSECLQEIPIPSNMRVVRDIGDD